MQVREPGLAKVAQSSTAGMLSPRGWIVERAPRSCLLEESLATQGCNAVKEGDELRSYVCLSPAGTLTDGGGEIRRGKRRLQME